MLSLRLLKNKIMNEIELWSQIKYSSDRIVFLMGKNKNLSKDLEKFIGKPIYHGILETIENHKKVIEEEKKIVETYYKQI